MDKRKGMFAEVQIEMLKVAFIYTFLDAIMLFFITFFIISFFNIKFLYSVMIPGSITFVFFVARFIFRINKMRLKDMEDANPQLKEMLRTAHDNMHEENLLTEALFMELKGKLRTASSGNLMESKKIITRIVSAVIIVFLIVFVSSLNFDIKKIDIPFEKLNFMRANGEVHKEGNITTLMFNQTDVIYGDADIAKLGNDKIDLKVNPTTSEIDFNNVKDAEDQQLREGGLPQEVSVTADAFSNQKVLDEAEQAANYSQRIRNI